MEVPRREEFGFVFLEIYFIVCFIPTELKTVYADENFQMAY